MRARTPLLLPLVLASAAGAGCARGQAPAESLRWVCEVESQAEGMTYQRTPFQASCLRIGEVLFLVSLALCLASPKSWPSYVELALQPFVWAAFVIGDPGFDRRERQRREREEADRVDREAETKRMLEFLHRDWKRSR